ncbi:hypothetical protein BFJ71_g17280 [Fusarium oxysporum]|nr:hypothetical protein BFJ71_g17280 [Fusarium oxysporum]
MCIYFTIAADKRNWFWSCCECGHEAGSVALNAACPFCGHWRCDVLDRQQRVTLPVTSQSSRFMTALVENYPSTSASNATLSTSFAPGLIGKKLELDQSGNFVKGDVFDGSDSQSSATKSLFDPSRQPGGNSRATPGEQPVTQSDLNSETSTTKLWKQETTSMKDESPFPEPLKVHIDTPTNDQGNRASTEEVADAIERLEVNADNDNQSENDDVMQEGALEQLWFHENVRHLVQALLREWRNFRTQTNDQSPVHSSNTNEDDPLPSERKSTESNNRKRKADSDTGKGQKGSSVTVKRCKAFEQEGTYLPLACPFSKKNLAEYRECTKFAFKRPRDVKQHLKRTHYPELNEATKRRLQKPSVRGSREDQWFEIFDILFPGHLPRPISPYKDFEISEQPPLVGVAVDNTLHIYEYLMAEGADALQREINLNPAFSSEGGPGISDVRQALDRVFRQYLNQQPELSRETSAGTRERSLSNSRKRSQEDNDQNEPAGNNSITDHCASPVISCPDYESTLATHFHQASAYPAEQEREVNYSLSQTLGQVEDQDLIIANDQEQEPLPSEFEELELDLSKDFLSESILEHFRDDGSY